MKQEQFRGRQQSQLQLQPILLLKLPLRRLPCADLQPAEDAGKTAMRKLRRLPKAQQEQPAYCLNPSGVPIRICYRVPSRPAILNTIQMKNDPVCKNYIPKPTPFSSPIPVEKPAVTSVPLFQPPGIIQNIFKLLLGR